MKKLVRRVRSLAAENLYRPLISKGISHPEEPLKPSVMTCIERMKFLISEAFRRARGFKVCRYVRFSAGELRALRA